MSLKDMKSDLSKFRLPKKEPLKSKENPGVNKNLNKTPLSSMAEAAPKIPRSQTTTNKEGVNPQTIIKSDVSLKSTTPQPMSLKERFLGQTDPTMVNQTEKFKGETNPSIVNQTEKFKGETNPTILNKESKFLGETNPKEANNKIQFLGETTPKEANKQSKFLGETTPTPANNESKFLGETTPNGMDTPSGERFLGETTPNASDRSSNFLGETTPNTSDRSSKFLGETTPNESDRSSNFLGETTPMQNEIQSNFLGETTPTPANNESNFLGETTPNKKELESNFLGETSPSPMNIPNGEMGLGETTPIPMEEITGEAPMGNATLDQFGFSSQLQSLGRDFEEVNYFEDIHAIGFNSRFGGIEDTKFTGVGSNNTLFDNTNSVYSNRDSFNFRNPFTLSNLYSTSFNTDSNNTLFSDISSVYSNRDSFNFRNKFTLGSTYGTSFDDAGGINSGEEGFGIGKGHAQRQSPSFLDEMYSKFNLRDDAFNAGLGLFRHPLILRGIQRKKISKGEPQNWGLLGFNYDEGAMRGGIVTSTARALTDVIRIGKWFASIPGVLWGAKQLGLQRSQKFGKVWTPVGLLAAIGGQHIGLKAQRPGLIPLVDSTFQYQDNTLNIVKDKLETMYKTDLFLPTTLVGTPFITQTDARGGFNSLYGINIAGPGFTTRGDNTFNNASQREASSRSNHYQWYTPVGNLMDAGPAGGDAFNTYGDDTPLSADEAEEFGLGKKLKDGNFTKYDDANVSKFDDIKIKTNDESHPLHKLDASDVLQHYETVAYGKRPDRIPSDKKITDFRGLLEGKHKDIADAVDYKSNNLEKKMFGGQNPAAGTIEDRTDYTTTDGTSVTTKRWDVINALEPKAAETDMLDDFVKFYIQPIGQTDGEFYQFRGTVTGLTETFSPSWDSIKFSGRADQGYKYGTFERSVSFNFQMWATSRIEMKPMYKKLEALSTFTMPEYQGSKGYQGMLTKFTLGDLYVNKLSFIDSLTYTFSDDAPWDINLDNSDLGVMPMGIDVAIGFKILDKNRPQYKAEAYDLKWRT